MGELRIQELTARTATAAKDLTLKPGQEAFLEPATYTNHEPELDPAGSWPRVILDGEDVSSLIRTDSVALTVSKIATNLEARNILGHMQRDVIAGELEGGFSEGRGIVAEGRDITTVIAPDAPVRVLLTADEDIRVARRAGEGADKATVREAVLGRDAKDSTVVNFHTAADGVHSIDTSELTIDEVVNAVIALVNA